MMNGTDVAGMPLFQHMLFIDIEGRDGANTLLFGINGNLAYDMKHVQAESDSTFSGLCN